jgi:hypothetical protein
MKQQAAPKVGKHEVTSQNTWQSSYYLQHNRLTKLERGAFGRLPVVFELNLAHNLLDNITSRAFEGLLQLLTLNLTANNLTTIPNGAFQGEPHFTAVKLNVVSTGGRAVDSSGSGYGSISGTCEKHNAVLGYIKYEENS